jgi:hypothetical protein
MGIYALAHFEMQVGLVDNHKSIGMQALASDEEVVQSVDKYAQSCNQVRHPTLHAISSGEILQPLQQLRPQLEGLICTDVTRKHIGVFCVSCSQTFIICVFTAMCSIPGATYTPTAMHSVPSAKYRPATAATASPAVCSVPGATYGPAATTAAAAHSVSGALHGPTATAATAMAGPIGRV